MPPGRRRDDVYSRSREDDLELWVASGGVRSARARGWEREQDAVVEAALAGVPGSCGDEHVGVLRFLDPSLEARWLEDEPSPYRPPSFDDDPTHLTGAARHAVLGPASGVAWLPGR